MRLRHRWHRKPLALPYATPPALRAPRFDPTLHTAAELMQERHPTSPSSMCRCQVAKSATDTRHMLLVLGADDGERHRADSPAMTDLDTDKAEQFGGQMVGVMNNAMLALMISVGHRTGLFDQLAGMPPSTSEEIADKTGLNERYVREWLNAMTVGRIVEYDPAAKTYRLPPEHAVSLTRASGPGNIAAMAQFTSLMGGVEDDIVECFQQGGGVPYSRYPKFQQLMAEMSAQVHDAALIDGELAAGRRPDRPARRTASTCATSAAVRATPST